MAYRVYLLSVSLAILFMVLVIMLVRRGKLQERYALLWIAASFINIIIAFWPQSLEILAKSLRIYYAPSLLFLMAILFGFAVMLHLSVIVSQMTKRTERLAQEVALLRNELEKAGDMGKDEEA